MQDSGIPRCYTFPGVLLLLALKGLTLVALVEKDSVSLRGLMAGKKEGSIQQILI